MADACLGVICSGFLGVAIEKSSFPKGEFPYQLITLFPVLKIGVPVSWSELKIYHEFPREALKISVKNRDISTLIESIKSMVGINLEEYKNTPMLTNARQLGLMEKALSHLDLAIRANEENTPVDLIAIDLQDCYYSL